MPHIFATISGDDLWHLTKGIVSAAAGLTVLIIEFLKRSRRRRKDSEPLPHVIWARLDRLERLLVQSTEPLPEQSPTSTTVDYEYMRVMLARAEVKLEKSQRVRLRLGHALYLAHRRIKRLKKRGEKLRTDLSAVKKLVVVPPQPPRTGT